jgi:hypothetical protein
MSIAILCPGCNSRLKALDTAAGKTFNCPKCKGAITVPQLAADAEFEPGDEQTPVSVNSASRSSERARVKAVVTVEEDKEKYEEPRTRNGSRNVDRLIKKTKKRKGSQISGTIIAGIVCGALLLGGSGFALYWFGVRDNKKEITKNTSQNGQGELQSGGSGRIPATGGMPGSGGSPIGASGGQIIRHGGSVKPVYVTSTAETRQNSNKNLRQVGIALLNSASSNNNSYPAGVYDSSGKVGLSWRVAILPHLGEVGLHGQFHLNEPWDSEHNKKLIPKMPYLYAAPGTEPNGMTYYRSFTGAGTVFPPPPNGLAGKDVLGLNARGIPDGTSNTAMVVEAGDPVEWTRPDELVYTAGAPLPRVGGIFGDGYHVILANGSTRWLKTSTPPKTLEAIITVNGGEVIDLGN